MGHKINYLNHNWLIIRIENKLISKYSTYFKGTVYDLGCGVQPYRTEILSVADKYIGVDWSNTLHDLKAEIVADLNKLLPIEDKAADTVVSFEVMEHLSEPLIFLKEAHRILKNNGNFVLTVPFQWWVHEAPYDYFRYTPYGLNHLLTKAGFNDIKVNAYAGFFTTWVMKINYFSARFIRGPKIIRIPIRGVLTIFWNIGQLLAPVLDKLDRNKMLEAPGYIVTAKK